MARPKKSAPAKAPVSAAAEVVEAVKETVATKKAAVQKVEEVYLQAGGCELFPTARSAPLPLLWRTDTRLPASRSW